eukprot:403366052
MICCYDVTQNRKKEYLSNKKLNSLKVSFENVLNTFQQGILITDLEQSNVLFINEELQNFFEMYASNGNSQRIGEGDGAIIQDENKYIREPSIQENLYSKLFNPYKVGDSSQFNQFETLSLSDTIRSFQNQSVQRQYFLIDMKYQQVESNSLFQQQREVIEIEFFNVKFEDKDSVIVIIRNISQLLNSEKERISNRYQEMLTATISHELMNPLNSIINLTSLAKQQYGGPKIYQMLVEDWFRYFKMINSSSIMMHHMVKSQIDIQLVKQNKFSQKISMQQPFQVGSVQLNIVESTKIPKNLYGDWERYQQILINFVQNSVKFTQKGEINIKIGFQSYQYSSSISLGKQKQFDHCGRCGYLVTKIKDTGIGMSESTKQSLFKLFNSPSQDEKGIIGKNGIGLGLSMSYDLIKALKGQVLIESQPGQGTEVKFIIGVQSEFCVKYHPNSSQNNTSSLLNNSQMDDQNCYRAPFQSGGLTRILEQNLQKSPYDEMDQNQIKSALYGIQRSSHRVLLQSQKNKKNKIELFNRNNKITNQRKIQELSSVFNVNCNEKGDPQNNSITKSKLKQSLRSQEDMEYKFSNQGIRIVTFAIIIKCKTKSAIDPSISAQNVRELGLRLPKNRRPLHRSQLDNKYQLEIRSSLQHIKENNSRDMLHSLNELDKLLLRSKYSLQHEDGEIKHILFSNQQLPNLIHDFQNIQDANQQSNIQTLRNNSYQVQNNYNNGNQQSFLSANQINIIINQEAPILTIEEESSRGIQKSNEYQSIPINQNIQNQNQNNQIQPEFLHQDKSIYNPQHSSLQSKLILSKPIIEQDEESDGTFLRQQSKKNSENTASLKSKLYQGEMSSMVYIMNPDNCEIQFGKGATSMKSGKFNTDECIQNNESSENKNLNLDLEKQQDCRCDCDSQVLIVDDSMFNLIPLELILQEINELLRQKVQTYTNGYQHAYNGWL